MKVSRFASQGSMGLASMGPDRSGLSPAKQGRSAGGPRLLRWLLLALLASGAVVVWAGDAVRDPLPSPPRQEHDFLTTLMSDQTNQATRQLTEQMAADNPQPAAELNRRRLDFYLEIGLVAAIVVGVLLVKLYPLWSRLFAHHQSEWPEGDAVPVDPRDLQSEAESVAAFAAALRSGSVVPVSEPAPPNSAPRAQRPEPAPVPEPRRDMAATRVRFLASAPEPVRSLQAGVDALATKTDAAERQAELGRIHLTLQEIKGGAAAAELVPISQLAYALECLVKQLFDKPERVTPSTLRTVAAGMDLLGELLDPKVPTNLCADPPIQLLAVDDEAISRHAIAFSLKRCLPAPDMASAAPAALELAAGKAYDVIFLDVQLPGMDGFELCAKIHQAPPNAGTPVVFVTSRTDFDARAKSELAGGTDLIAKPFLTFEITVKALTLAARRRLAASTPAQAAAPPGQRQTALA